MLIVLTLHLLRFLFYIITHLKLGFATATHNMVDNSSYLIILRPHISKSLNTHNYRSQYLWFNLLIKQIKNEQSRD